MTSVATIDEAKLMNFVHRSLGDMAATLTAALVVIGDKLGLYRAMADAGPITSAALAERTGTNERYVREWLAAQAAAGYISYEPESQRFSLSAEHAIALTDESSPACVLGGFQAMTAAARSMPRVLDAFRTGTGVGWDQHEPDLFQGTERFFRPGYAAYLVSSWIPALEGVAAKLQQGGSVADVGCGHGASTIIMAEAFPASRFVGFDYHAESIEAARAAAGAAGLSHRATFATAAAKNFPGGGFDLVTMFDCLHDMGDPVGAARHVRESLADGGVWMLVEPAAGDRLEDNLNPLGQLFYSVSTLICTPASLAQDVGLALGAQAGEARLREVVTAAGFRTFRRATETPFNHVYEARP